MTPHYIIPTRVLSLSERFIEEHISGVADEALFAKRSLGWFVVLEGSREALFLGTEKPEVEPGDEIEIVIRKKAKTP